MDHNDILAELAGRIDDDGEGPEYVKVSAFDVRLAAMQNPHHPIADILARSVEDHNEDRIVAVHRIDMLGLLRNRRVINRPLGKGRYQKMLGDEYAVGKPVETPLASIRTTPDEEPELGSTDGPEEDDEPNV